MNKLGDIVKIFDTTLRDGEQSPGFSMNIKEKIKMAKQLEKLGVDIIEAGFAISSKGDFESVKAIAESVEKPIVASLARASENDVKRAYEAVKYANKKRLHVFLATSNIHLKYKLKITKKEALNRVKDMVGYAKSLTDDVEFSLEDATRSDLDFIVKVVDEAIKAGAKTINLPDTVGYSTPDEIFNFIKNIKQKSKLINGVVISTHCHDDLGLATANSLQAIKAGARQVETTINGIGERAGNASLEEIVMSLKTRKDEFGVDTNVNIKEIYNSSVLLSNITGIKPSPNKAIIGENAFLHESGIHQHGVLANKKTYEIMTPESIGIKKSNLVLGKHSGKHALKNRLSDLGIELNEEELEESFQAFKSLADKKKKIFDQDLIALASKRSVQVEKILRLDSYALTSGNNVKTKVSLTLSKNNKKIKANGQGDGPVNAAFIAIDKALKIDFELIDYKIDSVTKGEDALGDAFVMIKGKNSEKVFGRGLSTDIVEASIFAYINAINKILSKTK